MCESDNDIAADQVYQDMEIDELKDEITSVKTERDLYKGLLKESLDCVKGCRIMCEFSANYEDNANWKSLNVLEKTIEQLISDK